MKIKTGDNVRIIAGKDKGKQGKIIQVFPKLERIVVEGANLMTKHLRKQQNRPGQKIQFSAPMHYSNVQIISAKSGKIGRVGYKFVEKEGKQTKIRRIHSKGQSEDIE